MGGSVTVDHDAQHISVCKQHEHMNHHVEGDSLVLTAECSAIGPRPTSWTLWRTRSAKRKRWVGWS